METRLCRDHGLCRICRDIGKAINLHEELIVSMQHQHDNPASRTPAMVRMLQDSMKKQIEQHEFWLQGLKNSYREILGVEYGSEQTLETPKEGVKDLLSWSLYRRGITNVEYEDIGDRDGEPYVRLYWTEKIK